MYAMCGAYTTRISSEPMYAMCGALEYIMGYTFYTLVLMKYV
jgi:hypothetical protein